MKSVRLHDMNDIRFEEVAMAPPPQAGEVRVAVAFAGICGSDIHNFRTGQWITRKPSIAGHEFSGVIESVGGGVTCLKSGDQVVADSRVFCGSCPNCRADRPHLCESLGFVGEAIDGGFTDFVTLPAHLVIRCSPGARLDVMALAEPLAVALHALAKLNAPAGAPILIVGCGPIGALCAVAARLAGDAPLSVCDKNADRQSLVCALTNAEATDLSQIGHALRPVHHAVDTTGNVGIIGSLIDTMSGASIALVGIGSGVVTLDPVHLVEREITLIGCHAFRGELRPAVRMLEENPDAFAPLIGPLLTLEQVPAAYGRIIAGKADGIKTMIRVGA